MLNLSFLMCSLVLTAAAPELKLEESVKASTPENIIVKLPGAAENFDAAT